MQSQFPNVIDSVGRLIDTQQEWRGTLNQLASDWLDEHCERANIDRIALRRDNETEATIIITALQKAWDLSGWPRGEMNREHWLRLVDAIRAAQPTRFDLPGEIDVCTRDDSFLISLTKREKRR